MARIAYSIQSHPKAAAWEAARGMALSEGVEAEEDPVEDPDQEGPEQAGQELPAREMPEGMETIIRRTPEAAEAAQAEPGGQQAQEPAAMEDRASQAACQAQP